VPSARSGALGSVRATPIAEPRRRAMTHDASASATVVASPCSSQPTYGWLARTAQFQ
jgi:hypothetical protein